jgi:hypothetical protein
LSSKKVSRSAKGGLEQPLGVAVKAKNVVPGLRSQQAVQGLGKALARLNGPGLVPGLVYA